MDLHCYVFRAVQLLSLTQVVHTIYCILVTHVKPVKYTGVTDVNIIVEIHLELCLVLLENAQDLFGLSALCQKKRASCFNEYVF